MPLLMLDTEKLMQLADHVALRFRVLLASNAHQNMGRKVETQTSEEVLCLTRQHCHLYIIALPLRAVLLGMNLVRFQTSSEILSAVQQ